MQNWKLQNPELQKIKIEKFLPSRLKADSLIYVVNQTSKRLDTLLTLINFDVPVLIEKPLFLNSIKGENLVKQYESQKVKLLSAQVFRFMKSLGYISNLVRKYSLSAIDFYWLDSPNEIRHGEIKKSVMEIPIYFDVLPHIISIIHEVFPSPKILLIDAKIDKESDTFIIELELNNEIPVNLYLSKSGEQRSRVINFWNENQLIDYNFSEIEKLTIYESNGESTVHIFESSYPLRNMLIEVFDQLNGREFGDKFSLNSGVESVQISEQIHKIIDIF